MLRSKVVGGGIIVGALLAAGSAVAGAAGGGYGVSSPPPTSAPGGFTVVAASQTVGNQGASFTGNLGNGAEANIDIPAGDFVSPVQVTIYSATDVRAVPGAVTGLRIVFSSSANGPLAKPITISIHDSDITAADIVEEFDSATNSFIRYADATISQGAASILITTDPTFVITTQSKGVAPASTVVPGATSVTTGVPVTGMLLMSGGLFSVGGTLLLIRRKLVRTKA